MTKIKWYGENLFENELHRTIWRNLNFNDLDGTIKYLVDGIKGVALSNEEKTFKVSYRPYMILDIGAVEGDIQIKFVKAEDIVDAQDQILNSMRCRIVDIEEVK